MVILPPFQQARMQPPFQHHKNPTSIVERQRLRVSLTLSRSSSCGNWAPPYRRISPIISMTRSFGLRHALILQSRSGNIKRNSIGVVIEAFARFGKSPPLSTARYRTINGPFHQSFVQHEILRIYREARYLALSMYPAVPSIRQNPSSVLASVVDEGMACSAPEE
jgi:hypothetical protein